MNILPQRLNALDVLNIFIEEHRICSPLDFEADETIILNFNTTVRDWREADVVEKIIAVSSLPTSN